MIPEGGQEIPIAELFTCIGELYFQNRLLNQRIANANKGVQTSGGGVREAEPAQTENNKMHDDVLFEKVPRQGITR